MSNKFKIAGALIGVFAVFLLYRFGVYLHALAGNGPKLAADTSSGQNDVTCPTCDPDHDGLTNAQEIYWGTDPLNPDTNGDGIKDGLEVASGNNPLTGQPFNTGNLTNEMSGLIVSGLYAGALNPASSSYDQAMTDISSSVSDSAKYAFYSQTDPSTLSTIEDSKESHQQYLQALTPVIQQLNTTLNGQYAKLQDSLTTIGNSGYTNDIKNSYSQDADTYAGIGQELSKINPPASLAPAQAELMDMINEVQAVSAAISHGDTDPVKASIGFQYFSSIQDLYGQYLADMLTNIQNDLSQ